MSGRWTRYFEWSLNAVSVLLLAILAGTFAGRFASKVPTENNSLASPSMRAPRAGEALNVPSVEWGLSARNLVFGLSMTCPYCRDSLPFYEKLSRLSDGRSLRTIALFPEPEDAATDFLAIHGVRMDVLRRVKLSTIGITGTPTLILTDERGRVLQSWIGRLSPEQEEDVLRVLSPHAAHSQHSGAKPAPHSGMNILSVDDLKALKQQGHKLALIDTRERRWFNASHIADARNIPADELVQRAPHEVPMDSIVVVICRSASAAPRPTPVADANTLCGASVLLFNMAGFGDVRVLDTHGSGLREASIQTVSSAPVSLPRVVLDVSEPRT
ncbi:MAG TPA: rhodanese-like domain-containing protein [Steroidobacteraceae bacterium]|nr:rhodanese-like domain-containing protein [Steroidobacteraceae bacterium]